MVNMDGRHYRTHILCTAGICPHLHHGYAQSKHKQGCNPLLASLQLKYSSKRMQTFFGGTGDHAPSLYRHVLFVHMVLNNYRVTVWGEITTNRFLLSQETHIPFCLLMEDTSS